MSDCPECDEPLIWSGMNWMPHTDRRHAATRRRLISHLAKKLRARAAVKAGHLVAIRFTATEAWFECACGGKGPMQSNSSYARGDAFEHLALIGD
jgi:hypothetical protein